MIYTIPTKKGIGVELWGTYDDIKSLYAVVGKFWNNEDFADKNGFENRDTLLSGFSYEIRKCYEGNRLKQEHSHISLEPVQHFGTQFSWVHILFSLAALRFNMRYMESNKYDLSIFLQLEFWLEKSMRKFDEVGATKVVPFITDGLSAGNSYLYQYMRSVNLDFILLKGGKAAFRKLQSLLRRGTMFTSEYNDYLAFLTKEAKRLNCEIDALELHDDDIDYDPTNW